MNKKIKIIELLNKIAKKEELPKKIKYESVFELQDGLYISVDDTTCRFADYLWCDFSNINDYVEILEDNTEEIEEKSNFEDMGYEIAQAYFEFYKGIAKALAEKKKESEDKQ